MKTATVTTKSDKPMLKLLGTDGNAFMLLGLAHRAAKKAGWTAERWAAVRDEAMAGGYNHLLQVLMAHFDVR